MVNKKLKVVIDEEAKKSFYEACQYIRKDSLKNADKVRDKILASIKDLANNPEKHRPDKYRAYEVYKYRIT